MDQGEEDCEDRDWLRKDRDGVCGKVDQKNGWSPASEETATRRAPSGSEETQPGRDDETLIDGRRSGSSRLMGSSASRDAQCIVPGTSLASTRRWRTIPSSSRSSFRFHSSALFLARLAPRHDLQQALDCRHRERLNRGPSSRAARARGWVGRCRSRTVTTSAMGNDMRHLQEGVGPRVLPSLFLLGRQLKSGQW